MAQEEYSHSLLAGQNGVPSGIAGSGSDAGSPTGFQAGFQAGPQACPPDRRVAALLLWIPVLACGGLTACGPPDPPDELLAALDATSVHAVAPVAGLAYFDVRNAEEPWAVHLLRVDLGRCDLGLEVLEAPVSEGWKEGRNRVSELVTASGGRILAAVNGDFFTPEGEAVGTEVVYGEVRQVRNRPALAWHPGKAPWMGSPRAEGDSVLSLGWDLSRSDADGATQVIGGFPLLLHQGSRVGDLGVEERPSFSAARHPRTAVGYDADENLLWVIVVDGRQPDYSDGMTLPELATVFEALKVEEAVNLDGGGSTVMVLEGETVSRPSDSGGERPVVNAVAIRRDKGFCQPNG